MVSETRNTKVSERLVRREDDRVGENALAESRLGILRCMHNTHILSWEEARRNPRSWGDVNQVIQRGKTWTSYFERLVLREMAS